MNVQCKISVSKTNLQEHLKTRSQNINQENRSEDTRKTKLENHVANPKGQP